MPPVGMRTDRQGESDWGRARTDRLFRKGDGHVKNLELYANLGVEGNTLHYARKISIANRVE